MDKKLKKYGQSKKGNFKVIDTIGVPHPYCITPKHLSGTSMYLNGDTIREAEKTGAVCDICKKLNRKDFATPVLTYDEHEQALLVECKVEANKNEELRDYLLSIKDKAEKDNFAGFAFKKA